MTTNIDKTTIKCAVFDLDGTLLNTIKTINHYLNLALSEYGLGKICEQDCMSFVGDGAVKLIERALSKVGAENSYFDRVFELYNRLYNASPYYLTEVYDGIPELISELKGRGIKLCVLSNKPDFATRKAIDKFLPDSFHIVCGGIDGVPLKPSPEGLFAILNQLGISPSETSYIGDSEPDVMIAKASNIALPIFVSWGFRTKEQLKNAGAEIILDTPSSIINLIETDAN